MRRSRTFQRASGEVGFGQPRYLLTAIEGWAGDIVIRYGLDVMFEIQWDLWSEKVLPAVRDLKARWMRVGDGTVEAFMKDIQIDASSFPARPSS